MPATDGSLIFNTKIDISNVNKGLKAADKQFAASANKVKKILADTEKSAKAKAASIASEYKKTGESQSEALKHAWRTVKENGEEFSKSTSESFREVGDSVGDTTDSIGDSIKEFGKNIMESRDWITMLVKVVTAELKMLGDAAGEAANAGLTAFSKTVQGIGQLTAQTGKFTLKQFIGDWEDNNSSIKRLLLMAASAFSVYKLIDFGKQGIDLGSDLSEVQNVVDVTFSHMSDKVDEWAKKAQDAYGLSETMAKKFVGLYGSMSEAFGFTEQEAFEMSSTLAGLAGDVASFYNIDQDLAYTKLKSVFSGETETLKDLGIVMTENALNDYAMRKGIGKTVSKMSEAEKVTLRYNFVLDQLNNAVGDFSRTQNSWANQTRLLSLRWDTLKATMGRGFINGLTPVIKVVNQLLEKLQKVAEWFESFTTAIFGNSNASTGAMTEGLETAADTADTLADSIENVTEKSDELRYGLADFDELNVITDNSDSESPQELVDDLVKASGVIDNLVEDTKNNAEETLSNIGFSEAVRKAIEKGNWRMVGFLIAENIDAQIRKIQWGEIKKSAVNLARNVGEFINGAFESPDLWISVGRTIAEGLNTAIKFLLTLLQTIDFSKIGISFAEMFNEFLKTFDAEEYGKLTAERINGIFDFLGGFAFNFDWSRLGDKIGETLASYFETLNLTEAGKSGKTIPETIAGIINGLIQAGISLLTYEFTDDNGEVHNLWEYVGTVLGEGLNSFLENFSLSDAVTLIKSGITAFLKVIFKAFKAIAGEDGNGFKKLGAELADELNKWLEDDSWWQETGTMLGEIINDILDFAVSLLANIDPDNLNRAIDNLFKSVDIDRIVKSVMYIASWVYLKSWDFIWKLIQKIGASISKSISDLFYGEELSNTLFTFFSSIWDNLTNGASGAWEAIKAIFGHVGDWFKNTFFEAWNKVKEVFSSGGKVFEGIKEGVASVFREVVNHLIDGMNTIISNSFDGINSMLSTVRDFEIFGNQPFGFIRTIDVPQIPRLATGTVVPANFGEFTAILGDNKREPEIVSPVSAIKQAIREVMAEDGYRGGSGGYINNTIVLPDGSVLLRVVGEADDEYSKSHGQSRFERRQPT